jgi:hypothetical protein
MALDKEFERGKKPSLLSAESANEFRKHLLSLCNMQVQGGRFTHSEANSILEIDVPPPGSIDATNLGDGEGILIEGSGLAEIEAKSLVAGDGITLTSDGATVTIAAEDAADTIETIQLCRVGSVWGFYKCTIHGTIDEPAEIDDGLASIEVCEDGLPKVLAVPAVEITE